MQYLAGQEVAYNYDPFILTKPEGNYNGMTLATAIHDLLTGFAITFEFEVVYNVAGGSITIEAKSEGMVSQSEFLMPIDFGIMTWMSNTGGEYQWKDIEGNIRTVDNNNLQSIHGVLRNHDDQFVLIHLQTGFLENMKAVFLICSIFIIFIYIVLI